MKPCFVCGELAPTTWNADEVFDQWVSDNEIIASWRDRFDGIRERLKWASVDGSTNGAHIKCALKWAIDEEGFGTRYPIINGR